MTRWLRWTALAFALFAGSAWAQESRTTEPLALRYDAPAACPDAAAFFAQLRSRTARVRAPDDGSPARALVVRVAAASRGFIGHFHFEDGGTSTSPRVVEASSCAEVVEALGLSAALAVDPSASTAPVAALSVISDASASSSTSTPVPPTPPSPVGPPPPDRAAPAPSPPRATRLGAGVAIEAAALLPSFVPSGRVYVEITLRDRAPLFAPSLRGFFARSLEIDQDPRIGSASLTWTTGGLDVCPIRVHLASTLALRPCAEVTAGVISTTSSGVLEPAHPTRPWVTMDAHARLAWEPIAFLALELEAGAMVPFFRERFLFLPDEGVYQAPIIGLFGRAGLAVHFP